jgi:hypothetical protein
VCPNFFIALRKRSFASLHEGRKKRVNIGANGKGRERSLLLLESQIHVFLLKNLIIFITGQRHNKK